MARETVTQVSDDLAGHAPGVERRDRPLTRASRRRRGAAARGPGYAGRGRTRRRLLTHAEDRNRVRTVRRFCLTGEMRRYVSRRYAAHDRDCNAHLTAVD